MEVDGGTKAPLTRLKRRMSVEQSEESKSPAINTPTKKRGGRRAAKPDLDLIDENNIDNNTLKTTTKRAVLKEITDPVEEKSVTPQRRSTRIKSNTSIVSDIALAVDSPRAKRAARRTSQIGSDTEAPLTPIRQTRKARKDSTSSVEIVDVHIPNTKPTKQITEVILEEPESISRKSSGNNDSNEKNVSVVEVRKSPRLKEKIKHNIPSNETEKRQADNNKSMEQFTNTSLNKSLQSPITKAQESKDEEAVEFEDSQKNRHSLITSNLLDNLIKEDKTDTVNLNMTTSALESKSNIHQTRQTRNDSTSSIEIVDIHIPNTKPTIQITEVVLEESKRISRKSSGSNDANEKNDSVGEVRKSPRLKVKKQNIPSNEREISQADKKSTEQFKNTSLNKSLETSISKDKKSKDEERAEFEVSQKNRHSLITSNLLNNLSTQDKTDTVNLNKSTSALESKTNGNKKRNRTKSWTTVAVSNENDFYSDNESLKKKYNLIKCPIVKIDRFNSGDGFNTSIDKGNKSKSKDNHNSFVQEDYDTSMTNKNNVSMDKNNDMSEINKLFEKAPSHDLKTIIFIDEDSDTNSGKVSIKNIHEHDDQCVPVVQHSNQVEKNISQLSMMSQKNDSIEANLSKNSNIRNDSCEPMDVDETIPESSVILERKLNKSYSNSPCVTTLLDKSESKEKLNKSKRKSSISNLNKSENENKSTLILSQLKDSSSGDINNDIKSQQIIQSMLSKTTDDLNITQENDNNKRNLSLNYVTTSTPLQQKKIQKLGNINTSSITSNISTNSIKNKNNNLSKNNNKTADNMNNESSSDEETSQIDINETSKNKIEKSINKEEKITSNESIEDSSEDSKSSNMMNDEAEDAGDCYQSGDSQDESERQYLRENEIIEKGETLTSDNYLSNDSDYKKDSFVVSSDDEDNELLNGTKDDLSMSDNELKMTTKSKKKYDERKKKEQKKASREMYESRHKLNISNKSSSPEVKNTKKSKKQELSSSESEDEIKSKKKNRRMKLDSSHEISLQEDEDQKKILDKKGKRVSNISCNEKEITVCNESLKEIDPLSTNVKVEPKTPQQANSSIAFINTENDPNIDNELTKTQTELLDPLEDFDTDDSLSSDNEYIMLNYDSILEGLNKTSTTKSKLCDISLNIDKKKKKKNTAIVDELNLTQVKSPKKNYDNKQKKNKNNTDTNKNITKPEIDCNSSSDSIDLNLLFSEDSNSSENIQNKQNNITSNTEDFIPLKRIEGKTNIRENTDNNTIENNVGFFIDTEGTIAQCDKSLNKSSSKKNKKKLSLKNNDMQDLDYDELIQKEDKSLAGDNTGADDNSDSDAPMDVPFEKEKQNPETEKTETDIAKDTCNKSFTKTPKSGKKNKKKIVESQIEEPPENVETLNLSLSKAKKKKSMDIINEESTKIDVTVHGIDESLTKTPGSKKKKRMSQSKIQEQDKEDVPIDPISTPSSISKKKKKLSYSPENDQIEPKEELLLDESKATTPGSKKKKKKSLKSDENEQPGHMSESSLNTSNIKTPGSQKKTVVKENIITPGSGKSNKIKSISFTEEENTSLTTAVETNDSKNSKKRKRKSSHTPAEDIVLEDEVNPKKLNESVVINQKKKRKVSQNETITDAEPTPKETLGLDIINKNNKIKKENDSGRQHTTKVKTNNKRKERDDDEGNSISKVAKESSFDTVHVPRLPNSILKQLDDKPKQLSTAKKPKLVSTTQFSVVEARKRRNKPSNYLEESVYLNDDEAENKKHKKVLQKPKVLPFVPTVLTSASGYTTNFKVNVIPTEIKFVAQSNTVSNFKEDFLFNKKIRRHGTYDLYKRKRNINISKF